MSVLTITANTEDGSLVAKLDGELIENVADLSIYTYKDGDGEQSLSINFSLQTQKSGDIHKRTNYSSYGSEQAKASIAENKAVYAVKDKSIVKFESAPDYTKSIACLLAHNNKRVYN